MDLIKSQLKKDDDFFIDDKLDQTNTSYIYGEVSVESMFKIFDTLNIFKSKESCSIVDVGSGFGKLVIATAIKYNVMIDGVEIDENRFNKSIKLLEQITNIKLCEFDLNSNIYFFNNSFEDVYFGNYDIIYCCNLVYSKEDNNKLFQKILREFKGFLFLFYYTKIMRRYFYKMFTVKTSWNDNQQIFLFKVIYTFNFFIII